MKTLRQMTDKELLDSFRCFLRSICPEEDAFNNALQCELFLYEIQQRFNRGAKNDKACEPLELVDDGLPVRAVVKVTDIPDWECGEIRLHNRADAVLIEAFLNLLGYSAVYQFV